MLLFDPKEEVYSKIELNSDKHQFKTPDELYSYVGLTGPVRSFSMSLFGERGRVSLRCHSFPGSPPTVFATGETDDWCIRAVETVDSFLVPHRLWYHPFTGRMERVSINPWFLYFGLLWFVMGLPLGGIIMGGFFVILFLLPVISLIKGVFLPEAVLRLSEQRQLVRQHV